MISSCLFKYKLNYSFFNIEIDSIYNCCFYIDIVGKTRIVVESLDSVQKKIKSIVDKYLNKEFFENFK